MLQIIPMTNLIHLKLALFDHFIGIAEAIEMSHHSTPFWLGPNHTIVIQSMRRHHVRQFVGSDQHLSMSNGQFVIIESRALAMRTHRQSGDIGSVHRLGLVLQIIHIVARRIEATQVIHFAIHIQQIKHDSWLDAAWSQSLDDLVNDPPIVGIILPVLAATATAAAAGRSGSGSGSSGEVQQVLRWQVVLVDVEVRRPLDVVAIEIQEVIHGGMLDVFVIHMMQIRIIDQGDDVGVQEGSQQTLGIVQLVDGLDVVVDVDVFEAQQDLIHDPIAHHHVIDQFDHGLRDVGEASAIQGMAAKEGDVLQQRVVGSGGVDLNQVEDHLVDAAACSGGSGGSGGVGAGL